MEVFGGKNNWGTKLQATNQQSEGIKIHQPTNPTSRMSVIGGLMLKYAERERHGKPELHLKADIPFTGVGGSWDIKSGDRKS